MKEEKQKNIQLRKGAYSGRYSEENQLGTIEIELQQMLKKNTEGNSGKKVYRKSSELKTPKFNNQ